MRILFSKSRHNYSVSFYVERGRIVGKVVNKDDTNFKYFYYVSETVLDPDIATKLPNHVLNPILIEHADRAIDEAIMKPVIDKFNTTVECSPYKDFWDYCSQVVK